ncbi:MAG: histidine kinase, partial [Bacteroidetes bacterium QS_4_64_154]
MAHSQAQDASPEAPSSSTDALADPQRIVDTVHEPLLVLDADLTVRQVNPAFYRVFSAAPDDTIGASLYELGGGHFD